MKKVYPLNLLLLAVVIVLPSCKKQTDTFGPQISIAAPYENQQYAMYEDIQVVANVCDDRKLSYIDISVTDPQFVTVIQGPTLNPENNCREVNVSLPVDNIYLPSGDYYVLIRASDGVLETKMFRKIYITTLPKKLKYLVVVSKNAGQVHVSKIDSTFTLTPLKTLNMDYSGSTVSSDARQFYIAGRYNGDVQVFSTIDWELQWSIPCIVSPPFPYFEAIDVHNKMLYISYRSGKFEVYNANGGIIAQRTVDDACYPKTFTPSGNYLLSYQRNASAMLKYLMVYFTPSYAIQQKLLINYEILDVLRKDNDNCLVFCNHVNYATIKLYTISSHSFWNAYTEMAGNITSVAQADQNTYLYISNNGVYWYNYQNTSSVPVNSGPNIHHLVFDETTYHYYFSENYHTVKQFQFPNSTLQASVQVPDTIINILPVYNKD